jgi:hypothetical protein
MSGKNDSIRYDDVLPNLVKIILTHMGQEALSNNLILRDADGVVTFVLRENYASETLDALNAEISATLLNYASSPPVATAEELYDDSLNDCSNDGWELVRFATGESQYIRYIERRIVGNDWVRGIFAPLENTPPIVVFSSHKGGVGRSTALSVACSELARLGKSVLAIDLDLEAPGIGGMFNAQDSLPLYGAIDYYVEFGRSPIDGDFISNMRSDIRHPSSDGSITIVAASGRSSRSHPENVIGKISRAYLESTDPITGVMSSFLDKTRKMLTDLCEASEYDVIFIDARAGLNESTAATLQGLGADVLFFGIDTPQTWEGYNYFLSHLARFKSFTTPEVDWRHKIKMVHAKATNDSKALAKFNDESFDLFARYLYDEIGGDENAGGLSDAFGFDLNDETAPHFAWPIFISPDYFEFDPIKNGEQLSEEKLQPVFGQFLDSLKDRLEF